MDPDKQAKEDYAKQGVDLPELKEKSDAEAEAKAKEEAEATAKAEADEKAAAEAKAKEEAEAAAHLQTPPKPEKPRTIYDDYKDKKLESKENLERAEKAEKERDELAARLQQVQEGKGGDTEANEDAIAYAKKVGADPDLVKRIIDDARKGYAPQTDEALKKDLDEFKAWRADNAKQMEAQRFETEFASVIPAIKEQFPQVSDKELAAIKTEIDTLSHTKEWHDKSLDYIVFKHKDKLSALVSPKKRGMESKGRHDVEPSSFEFDPNADYSTLTPEQKVEWEKAYRRAAQSDGLLTDANGRKSIL